jgi:tRNA splicing ligase
LLLKSLLGKESPAEKVLKEIENTNEKINKCGQKRTEYLVKLDELKSQKIANLSQSLDNDKADDATAANSGLRKEIEAVQDDLRDIEDVANSLLTQKEALVTQYCDLEYDEHRKLTQEMNLKHTKLYNEIEQKKKEFKAWLEPKEMEGYGLYAQYRQMSSRDKLTPEGLMKSDEKFALYLPWNKSKTTQIREVMLIKDVQFDGAEYGKGNVFSVDRYPVERLQSLVASGNAIVSKTCQV